MTRKITTILLALALCLTLLPVGAGAAASSPSGVELKMNGTTLMYGDNNVDTTGEVGLQVTFDPSNENCIATVHGYVLNGGTYYLDSDVTIDKPLLIKGTSTNPTTLDLNGYVLKYKNDAQKSSVIVVADSAYFVLQDSEPNREHHFTKNDSTGLYTLADDTTTNTITLTGGVITGGTGTKCGDNDFYGGGGVFVGSKANFTMTGGNIVGCTAASTAANSYAYGGGVFVAAGDNPNYDPVKTYFTMTGGSIVGCTAASAGEGGYAYGGGVFLRGYTNFTMGSTDSTSNARIANCAATSGGGVYINRDGTFIMQGGTIENCRASSSGGGVYNYGTFTMESGTIENCTATNGGGVYVDFNSFTMKGGTIKNCTATNGDGVYINGISMDAQGGSVYGGVYNSSTLKNISMDSSTIFYPDTNGNAIVEGVETASIAGKQVKFMNGETLYAETVAAYGGKISAPVAPTKDGKAFLGWFTKNAVTGNEVYQKCEFTNGTAPVPAGDTLYAFWDGDFVVEVSGAQNNTDGYYRTFAEAWSGASGDSPTFTLLKDVNVNGSLSYSRFGATLDSNGHKFSGNITISGALASRGYLLTLTSSADNGNFDGTVTAADNLAQLTVSGGTVKKVVVGSGGTLNCIGGTITTLTVTGGTVNHTGGTASCTAKAVCTVCNTSYGELANHSGGTATCKELAECSVCHQPYGSKDPTNHAGTLGGYQHDKDGHWQVCGDCEGKVNEGEHSFGNDGKCSVCGYEKPRRVYRSGTPTISAVLSHPDAASATNYTSGIYGLTFRSTASFSSFRGVQVDGKTIASTNYIAEEGSIVVYLKAVYLQTLAKGTHTVTILSTEGNATMDFTIGGVQSAKTGDPGVAIYALMALTSYTGTALVVRGRKRK